MTPTNTHMYTKIRLYV